LDVVARHPDRFEVIALSAHTQTDRLFRTVRLAIVLALPSCPLPKARVYCALD
jgi:1-deoxy-D-xylulose 5-phosphate reductoisomerase